MALTMPVEKMSMTSIAKKIRQPIEKWPGNCYAIASAIVKAKLVQGRVVYGLWWGPIAPGSYFSYLRGPVRHGWIVCQDGRIVDPTRWAFENDLPYIWVGDLTNDYDEGMNRLRSLARRPCPERSPQELVAKFKFPAKHPASAVIKTLIGHGPPYSRRQLFWLANTPYDDLCGMAIPIYRLLIRMKFAVWIPCDNRERAKAEGL